MKNYFLLSCVFLMHRLFYCASVVKISTQGNDGLKCLQHPYRNPCASLEFVAEHLKLNCSGLTIKIESNQILRVRSTVLFENCASLKVSGGTGDLSTTLFCSQEAGFRFKNVTDLCLLNLSVKSCGTEVHDIQLNSSAAMHIHQSCAVMLRNVIFINSSYTALVVSDTLGKVEMENCCFLHNYPPDYADRSLFPGGMHIQLSVNNLELSTDYVISSCIFSNNTQKYVLNMDPAQTLHPSLVALYGYGLGGGLAILFMGNCQNISVTVQNCNFSGNAAHSGAGLYVHFQDSAKLNEISISNSEFLNGTAIAGGGLAIGMSEIKDIGNYVSVTNSTFFNNTARYGGGTVIFTIHGGRTQDGDMKLIHFDRCIWKYNYGPYSPAVDMMPLRADQFNHGYLPTPYFTDCEITSNTVTARDMNRTSNHLSGTFVTSSLTVVFGRTMLFHRNKNTALKLVSGNVLLENKTTVHFDSNEGSNGGAMAVSGFSSLVGNKDCLLNFTNNFASSVGGGIFYSPIEQREFLEGKSCFLQYAHPEERVEDRNYTFIFTNNSAELGGSAIYATSLYSCFFACHNNLTEHNLTHFKDCIGSFKISNHDNYTAAIKTSGIMYAYQQTRQLEPVPGELLNVPLSLFDEFGQKSDDLLFVTQMNDTFHGPVSVFTNNMTRVCGKPGELTHLYFKTEESFRTIYYNVSAMIRDCPPGYYFDNSAQLCKCSADNSKFAYLAIVQCDYTAFRAFILRGYWIGMHTPPGTNTSKLFTSSHSGTTSFAHLKVASNHSLLEQLPGNVAELNDFSCGKNRKGILCGKCVSKHSAYYHSRQYKCGSQERCHLGLLFYILSEIIPLAIVFCVVLLFNVNVLSGHLTGFIFFSQVVDIFSINLNRLPQQELPVKLFKRLQDIYRLFYDMFSLNFFNVEPLAFCPWKGAAMMDVIAIRYFSTIFCFLLVLGLVKALNSSCCKCGRNRRVRIKHSYVKGLCAFLVLSHSQCTKITFQILSQEVIVSNNRTPGIAVTEYGGLPYLKSQHLIYAVPALVFLFTLVLLPVLYLLVIPLALQLLSVCGLGEHCVTTATLRLLCQPRMMPILDTFHSAFKPRLRFFAGLYFVYKIVLLAELTLSKSEVQFFNLTTATLVLILGLHAIAQPYQQNKNNMIDSALLLNLALINGLNMAANSSTQFLYDEGSTYLPLVLIALQLLLVPSPVLALMIVCCSHAVKKKLRRPNRKDESYENVGERRLLLSHDLSWKTRSSEQKDTVDTY